MSNSIKNKIVKKGSKLKESKSKNTKSNLKTNASLDKLRIILNKIKKIVFNFFKSRWDLILLDIIIFILTVFIESQYLYKLKLLVWFFNTILFIVLPTILFTIIRPLKSKDIFISLPIFYILFLIFLDYCTIRELYGISSLGLDKTPNYIDALLVVFIFTSFEYITAFIVNKIKDKKINNKAKKVISKNKKIKK